MGKICKPTLTAVKADYDVRIQEYIKKLYNKSFEEITDKENPLHKVGGVKFLDVKKNVGSSGFSIDINQAGVNKLIVKETYRIMKKDGSDESILPPLPPASMLPGTPSNKPKDNYNYSETLAHRKNLKADVDRKVLLLQNEDLVEGRSKEQLEQVAHLKDLSVQLFKEIMHLEANDKDADAFIDNLTVDIANMKNLLKNPTIENLEFVRKYKDMVDYFVQDNKDGFLKTSLASLKKSNPAVYDKIIKAQLENNEVNLLYKDQLKLKIIERVEHFLKQSEDNKNASETFIKEEAQKLYEEQFEAKEDLNFILRYYTRMDKQEDKGNVIASAIKKSFDDAVRNNGKKGVEDKLLAKEAAVVARLKEIGQFTGTFFSKKAVWDIFKTDNPGESRLLNVFTVGWQKFKRQNEIRQKNISKIFYNFSAENSDAQINTIDKHYNDLKEEVDFIDVRKIPELLGDSSFSEFASSFAPIQEAEEYKKKLITRIGKREYAKLVKEAQDNVNSFMIEKDVKLNQLLDEYKVEDISKLQQAIFEAGHENVWNFYLQNFYTKSPFVFSENHFDQAYGNKVAKVFYVDNKQHINYNSRANLEYGTFIPKDKHKEAKFEENIKGDPVLEEAWELMDELVEYSNKNGSDYNSQEDLLTDLGHENKSTHILLDVLGLFSPKVLENIKRIASRVTKTVSGEEWKKDTGEGRNITGQRVTTESKLRRAYGKLLAIDRVEEKNLSEDEIQNYRERALVHVNEQADNDNLLHNIVTSSQMTGAFKARKEVETLINFLANQLKGIKSREGFSALVDYFINKNLYGINNRGKFGGEGKYRNRFGKKIKHYPTEHAKMRTEITAGIEEIQKLLKADPENKELQQNIADLEAMYEDGVLYVNGRDVTEAVLFKMKAFTAFAINGSAQVTNMALASANAYEVDGRPGFWKAGKYTKAMSFARKYKNVKLITSKKMQKQRTIMDLFLKSADLVQNSANEIYKEKNSRFGSAIKETLKNPTNFVGEVEKTIQKPQLLALLSDVMVSDGKGFEVPVFDADAGKFPAFDIKDGVLVLNKMFDTKENRDTFINFNSQEAANIFGESGKLPKAIAYINGDYRDSSSYLAEKYLITAMSLMFKRWAVATIYKKAGIYKRLAKNDHSTAAIGYQLLKGNLFAISTGAAGLTVGGVSLGITMPVALAMGIGFYVIKNRRSFIKTLKEDTKKMEQIYKNLEEVKLGLTVNKFMKGSLTVSSMAISTAAQAILNIPSRFIGRDVLDSDKLKSMIYIDKSNLQDKVIEEIQADLYFLQTSAALVIRNMVYAAMLHTLYSVIDAGFDDDEEKEAFKEAVNNEKGIFFAAGEQKSKIDTLREYPALSSYYALNNMLAAFTQDMSMTENVEGMQRMGQLGSFEDVWKTGKALVEGTKYKKKTKHHDVGDSKGWALAKKYVTPSSVNLFGFGSKVEKDYNTKGLVDTHFKTNFEVISEIHKEHKEKAKVIKEAELRESTAFEYQEDKEKWIENKLTQFSETDYPTLKLTDFYEDGTLNPGGENKVRNYKDKLPEKMQKEIFND